MEAQFRRDAPIQHLSGVEGGDLLVGAGFGVVTGAVFPASGLSGNLTSVPEVSLLYGLGTRAAIGLTGAAFQRLKIGERSTSRVVLDPGVDDGVTTDAGDFVVTASFAPLGSSSGFSAGGLVEVRLPNSDETRGIGTNTTDVTLGVIGAWSATRWRGAAMVGIAIEETPLNPVDQNDLVAYAVDLLVNASERLRMSFGVSGAANTRGTAPAGTESHGMARAGVEWLVGSWRFDASLGRGIVDTSTGWRLAAGFAWTATGDGR
ncbi:MAG: hypothetical protein R3195_01070 [Gemmatimonadota bacterium]|nr:hypothetical protein [Gemmatimonadota bacterium]